MVCIVYGQVVSNDAVESLASEVCFYPMDSSQVHPTRKSILGIRRRLSERHVCVLFGDYIYHMPLCLGGWSMVPCQ